MASNIKEKNLVYSFDEQYSLPYDNVKKIEYSPENPYVNSIAMDNIYQQLIDNDKVVAQTLASKTKQSIGPTVLEDGSQVTQLNDGQKFFLPDDSHVYVKKFNDLQSCISKLNNANVKHMFMLQDSTVLASYDSRTYYISYNDGSSTPAIVEVQTASSKAIELFCQCQNGYADIFFGGKESDGTYGIYAYNTTGKSFQRLVKVQGELTGLAYRSINATLVFSTSSGLFQLAVDPNAYSYANGILKEIDTSSIKQIYAVDQAAGKTISNIYVAKTDDGKTNPENQLVIFLSDGTIVASAISENTLSYSYEGLLFSETGIKVNCCRIINGDEWFSTNKGLYCKRSGRSVAAQIWPAAGGNASAVEEFCYSAGSIYFGNQNGEVFQVDANAYSFKRLFAISGIDTAIESVQAAYGMLFIGTTRSLRCYANNKLSTMTHDGRQLSVQHLLAKPIENGYYLYAAGKSGPEANNSFIAVSSISLPSYTTTDIVDSTLSNLVQFDSDDILLNAFRFRSNNTGTIDSFVAISSASQSYLYDVNSRSIVKTYTSSPLIGAFSSGDKLLVFTSTNVEIYNNYINSGVQYSQSFKLDSSFKLPSPYRVVDGSYDDSSHIAVLLSSDAGSYISYAYLDNASNTLKLTNPSTDRIYLGNVSQQSLMTVDNSTKKIFYALSGATGATSGMLSSFAQQDWLDGFDINGSVKVGTTELELDDIYKNFADVHVCPGPMVFLSNEVDDEVSCVAHRIDYVVPNAGNANVSAIAAYLAYNGEEFQLYSSRFENCGDASKGVADIKFADESLAYSNIALLCPKLGSTSDLSVVIGFNGTESNLTSTNALFGNSNKTIAMPGSETFVDAIVESASTDDNNTVNYTLIVSTSGGTYKSINGDPLVKIGSYSLSELTYANGNAYGFNGSKIYKITSSSITESLTVNGNVVDMTTNYSVDKSSTTSDLDKFISTFDDKNLVGVEVDEDLTYKTNEFSNYRKVENPKRSADKTPVIIITTEDCIYTYDMSSIVSTVDAKSCLDRSSISKILHTGIQQYSLDNILFSLNAYRNSVFSSQDYALIVNDGSLKKYDGNKMFAAADAKDGDNYPTVECKNVKNDYAGNTFVIPASTSNGQIYVYKKTSNAWEKISSDSLANFTDVIPCTVDDTALRFYLKKNDALYLATRAQSLSITQLGLDETYVNAIKGWLFNGYENINGKHHFLICQYESGPSIDVFRYKVNEDTAIIDEKFATSFSGDISRMIEIDGSNDVLIVNSGKLKRFNFDSSNIEDIRSVDDFLCPNGIYQGGSLNMLVKDQIAYMLNYIDDDNPTKLGQNDRLQDYIGESAQASFFNRYGSTYKMFLYSDSKTVELDFTGMNDEDIFFRKSSTCLDSGSYVNGIFDIGKNNLLLATASGLWRYDYSATSQAIHDSSYEVYRGSFGNSLNKVISQQKTFYTAAASNEILSSSNGLYWQKYATVGNPGTMICCYVQPSFNSFYAGKTDGLYQMIGTYRIENDTAEFTAESAMQLYNDKEDEINGQIQLSIDTHVAQWHGENSTNSLLEKYMKVDFELPAGFCQVNTAHTSCVNDYIETIMAGDSYDGAIDAYATNDTMTEGTWKHIDCSYIVKQWKSGMMEFFIYLPTTYTYYIPHVAGTPNCASDGNLVQADAKYVEPTVSSSFTKVKLGILSTYFNIDAVHENVIKGNSLPLKIYKDQTYTDQEGDAASMFHSFIEPSIASEIDTSSTKFDAYSAYYYVFGSDAQAIKLTVFDSKRNYKKNYKTVIYHGVDSMTDTVPPQDTVYQRILEGDSPKNIYWEIFKSDGGLFLGWATNKNAQAPDIDNYGSSTKFSYSSMNNKVLHLYAVWTHYQFSDNDTTITLQNTNEQTYSIAEITIDPNIKMVNNPDLGNRMIVKFDD